MKGKRSSLIEHLHTEKPKVCLLTETLLQSDRVLNISGYTFFGKARTNRKGGGVGILVENEIRNKVIPHTSDRPIEMTWVSIRRKNNVPLFIGCYYGKQESRCPKEDIQNEMNLLSEEIKEFRSEGEIIIMMDGNGKLGLLGEEKSRNGKMLEAVFEENNLLVLNKSDKCIGKVTRQNTSHGDEKSAIDFIVVEESVEKSVIKMEIDETGILRMKGEKDSDHNTIVLTLKLEGQEKTKPERRTQWRLNAPQECWNKFRHELNKLEYDTKSLFENKDLSLDDKYSRWIKKIDNTARISIGKSTIKNRKEEVFSQEVKDMRKEKREIKKRLKNKETHMVTSYGEMQEKIRNQILLERTERTNRQLKKMTEDKTRIIFWKERKKLKRNQANNCLTVKNENGERVYDPEIIKETAASYYEKLYSKKPVRTHSHHETVQHDIEHFKRCNDHEGEWYNEPPTKKEIKEIIERKKNGKASTDIKNEIIKGTGDEFIKNLMPVINEIWTSEIIPKEWNKGSITTIWKGKGDRECLTNHRGITVSSAVGNIMEEVIDLRMEKIIKFSQGQAGGIKGAATADHLFLLRGIMTTAQNSKSNLFLTFYDVSKAYDNADGQYASCHMEVWSQGKDVAHSQKPEHKSDGSCKDTLWSFSLHST